MTKYGIDYKELLDVLTDLDECTNIDSVVAAEEPILITVARKKCGKNGYLRVKMCSEPHIGKQPLMTGDGFSELATALEMRQEEALHSGFSILCFFDMVTCKSLKGMITTYWWDILPAVPFDLENGQPKFDTVKLSLTEEQLKFAEETKIAFFDADNKIVYPITATALPSLGRLLDIQGFFKKSNTSPLGTALCLADRIMDANLRFRLITRQFIRGGEKGVLVEPVIGLAGSKYIKNPQKLFFTKLMAILEKEEIPHTVEKWEVSDLLSSLTILLPQYNVGPGKAKVRLQISDVPGKANSLTSFYDFNGAEVTCMSSSKYKWLELKKWDLDTQLKSVLQELQQTRERLMSMQNCNVDAADKQIQEKIRSVYAPLGKKRTATINIPKEGIMNAFQYYQCLLQETYCVLPEKQAQELSNAYHDMISRVCEHLIKEAQPEMLWAGLKEQKAVS